MKRSFLTILCFTFIFGVVLNQTSNSTVSQMVAACEIDSTCPSGYRLRICGLNGYSYNECSSICTRPYVQSFLLKKCQQNYMGKQCSTNLCYYNRTINSCFSESSCTNFGYINYTKCQQCVNCETKVCFKQSTSPSDAAPLQCSKQTHCPFKDNEYRMQECPDQFSSTQTNCSCCMTQQFDYEIDNIEDIGQCLETADLLNQQDLKLSVNRFDSPILEECMGYRTFMFESVAVGRALMLVSLYLLGQIL